jgi:hypothetical protein
VPPLSEKEFQKAVIELAHRLGYRVAHFPKIQDKRGYWRTPVAADGKGFPDLLLVRGERLIFAELKAEGGRMTPEQDAWFEALRYTGALLAGWYPRDWPLIEQTLRDVAA